MKRINNHAAIVVNDTKGNERTGYGVTEEGYVILGMDYEYGEALVLIVNPQGYTGMIINEKKGPPNDKGFLSEQIIKLERIMADSSAMTTMEPCGLFYL